MTDQPTCATCRFWFGFSWECRRRPRIPVVFTDDQGINSNHQFPYAGAEDWCGEHQAVVEATPTVGPWRDAETDPPPGELDVLTWSRAVGLQVGFRSSSLVPLKWISRDGDSYRPTMWMAIPARPDGGEA